MADLNELSRSLGRIEGQLLELIERLDGDRLMNTEVGQRVGALERWRSFLAGAWAVMTIVIALLLKEVL